MALTAESLRAVLDYDGETGVFVWKGTLSNRRAAGDQAGCVCKRSGYRLIGINGTVYKACRLAWLYIHGDWPERFIDHINGRTDDDRIANLRLATHQQNLCNRGKQRNNTSGFKGVHRHHDRWRARIAVNGRHVSLGVYVNPEDAHRAYAEAAARYHGEFARAK